MAISSGDGPFEGQALSSGEAAGRVDGAPSLVDESIGERLPEVPLKGAFVARFEHLEAFDDADEHFLDDVARVDGAAGAARQPAAGPAMEAGQVAGAEEFDGVGVAGTRPQKDLERFALVHAPGLVARRAAEPPLPKREGSQAEPHS